ncbi:MAG TPA: alpha/beta family hydrolase [Kofleriaceae bacterium]|nr:alpha/beta family hydrolase [Kofleriaceae bacterium]
MAEREIDLEGLTPGLLVRPRNAKALYVLAHGAGAGMRHEFMQSIADALADHAIATLRWEFPYMAAGKPRPDTPAVAEAAVQAVWAASAKLARDSRAAGATPLPRFAGGKSFGGRMTSRSHAATPLADLRGLIFLGFPLHPPDKPGIERAEHLAAAAGPMLFLQGTRDDLADLKLLRPVIKKLGARATLHIVDHADHGFDVLVRSGRTPDDVMSELATTIAEWIAAH